MKIFTYLFPVVLIVFLVSSGAYAQKGPKGPTAVITARTAVQTFADQVEALGTTKANETVVITPDTSEKVSEIHFEDGQSVQKGDLLVTLDQKEEDAELKAAKAELSEARSAYSRAKELQGTRAVSKATLQERLAALKQSEAAVEVMEARIEELSITAPFDGILGLREVSVGTLVQPGDMITTIDDLSQIKVDFDVPSVFLPTLNPGIPVVGKVDAFGSREFEGVVTTVNTQIDPVTRTVRVRALLPNDDLALKPGLLMTITLFKNERDALLIPEEALIKRGDDNFVYGIEEQDGQTVARQKKIDIGGRRPGVIEVLSGLENGEQIIIHGIVKIGDGAPVIVRAVEQDADDTLDDLLAREMEKAQTE